MNNLFLYLMLAIPGGSGPAATDNFLNNSVAYTIGAILSLILLAYLTYALLKPEKF